MRLSKMFGQTLREAPAEAQVASHQLLLRAGFIRPMVAGAFGFLPLARRSLDKIENLLHSNMTAIGGQEITLPTFSDSNPEETIADLVRREIRSHRQLHLLLYQTQTRCFNDPHPRLGLLKAHETIIQECFSLDVTGEGLEAQNNAICHAYLHLLHQCDLPTLIVKSDPGAWGDSAQAWVYLTPVGEDVILLCNSCLYAADQKVASFRKTIPPFEQPLLLEKVATPDIKTIRGLAGFLDIPESMTVKAVFMIATIPTSQSNQDKFVFAIIRGDMEVNETKLANAAGALKLRPASDEEIRAIGAVPGYASPVSLASGAPFIVVVDDLIPQAPNLVAGANLEGYHLRNVNYGRDYQAHIVADIARAQAGNPCPQCGQPMRAESGIEVGKAVKNGTRLSEIKGCYFQDELRENKPVFMANYRMDTGRLLACIAERHHDEFGLRWPVAVSPYQVHLVSLASKADYQTGDAAEQLYTALGSAGIEGLYDDREESPGVKFNDADLIGLPIRLTVSQRSLKSGGVEFKRRDQKERSVVSMEQTLQKVKDEIVTLKLKD